VWFDSWKVWWISDSKGWGIKTLNYLKVGAFVFEFVKEIVNNEELAKQLDRFMHY
jgi:hypothetical protein